MLTRNSVKLHRKNIYVARIPGMEQDLSLHPALNMAK